MVSPRLADLDAGEATGIMTLLSLIPITLQTSIFLLVLSIGLTATLQDATLMFRSPSNADG
jgi:hypothetical protein